MAIIMLMFLEVLLYIGPTKTCTTPIYSNTYRYIGGNNIWRIARKRKKIAIGGYKFGGYGTIAMPSLGVGAILADLILADLILAV